MYGEYTQNVEANTSTITMIVDFVADYGIDAPATQYGTITIHGHTTDPKLEYNLKGAGNGQWKRLMSTSYTVAHAADGQLTVGISASVPINVKWNGEWVYTKDLSFSVALAAIPRATTPVLDYTTRKIGEVLRIAVPGKAVASFVHHVYATVGTKSDYFVGGIAATGNQYYDWTLPTKLVPYMGNSTSLTATVNVATLTGGGTLVGWRSKTFTLTLPDTAPWQPTISEVNAVEAATLPSAFTGVYVQGMSKLKVTTTAKAGNDATLSTYAVTVTAGSQIQSLSGQEVTSAEIVNSGNAVASAKVTDSRGRSVTKSTTVAVQPYSPPAITTLKCFRASSETGTPSDTGTWLAAQIVVSVASVSKGSTPTNAINSLTLEYREMGTTTWTAKTIAASGTSYSGTVAYSGFSTDKRYEVRVTAIDKKPTTSVALSALPTAYFVMDFSPDGKQVAIGAAATANGLEVAMPLLITDTARSVTKQNIFDLIWPVGKVEMTLVNTPPFYGTWALIGAGRTLVGVDTADTDFATPNKTGGAKTQKLSAQIGAMNNNQMTLGYAIGAALVDPADITYTVTGASVSSAKPTNVNHGTAVYVQSSTKRQDPSLVQPYLTCYIWQRTA
jgi:hypothetical protein